MKNHWGQVLDKQEVINAFYLSRFDESLDFKGQNLKFVHYTLEEGKNHPCVFSISVQKNYKIMYICCRGSTTREDWICNLKVYKSLSSSIGCVHSGFKKKAESIPIKPLFNKMQDGFNIVFCGFSQGSAIAKMLMLRMLELIESTNTKMLIYQLKFIGFAGPLVGDKTFCEYVNSTRTCNINWGSLFHNYVYKKDIVPAILSKFGRTGLPVDQNIRFQKFKQLVDQILDSIKLSRVPKKKKKLQSIRKGILHFWKIDGLVDSLTPDYSIFGKYYIFENKKKIEVVDTLLNKYVISYIMNLFKNTKLCTEGIQRHNANVYKARLNFDEIWSFEKYSPNLKYGFLKSKNNKRNPEFIGREINLKIIQRSNFSKIVQSKNNKPAVPTSKHPHSSALVILPRKPCKEPLPKKNKKPPRKKKKISLVQSISLISGQKSCNESDNNIKTSSTLRVKRRNSESIKSYRKFFPSVTLYSVIGEYSSKKKTIYFSIMGENLEYIYDIEFPSEFFPDYTGKKLFRSNNVIKFEVDNVMNLPTKKEVWFCLIPYFPRFVEKIEVPKIKIISDELNEMPVWVLLQNAMFQALANAKLKKNDPQSKKTFDEIASCFYYLENLSFSLLSCIEERLDCREEEEKKELAKNIDLCASIVSWMSKEKGYQIQRSMLIEISKNVNEFVNNNKFKDYFDNDENDQIIQFVKENQNRSFSTFLEVLAMYNEKIEKAIESGENLNNDKYGISGPFSLALDPLFKFSILQNSVLIKEVEDFKGNVVSLFLQGLYYKWILKAPFKCLTSVEGFYEQYIKTLCINLGFASEDKEVFTLEKDLYNFHKHHQIKLKHNLGKQLVEINKGMRDLEKMEKTEFKNVCIFYETAIRIHELRKELSKNQMLAIVGLQKTGKSDIVKKGFGFDSETKSDLEEGRFNTRDPMLYKLENEEYSIVDMPAWDDQDQKIRSMVQITLHSASCILVVLPLKNLNIAQGIETLMAVSRNYSAPILILCHRADEVYAHCVKQIFDEFTKDHKKEHKKEQNKQTKKVTKKERKEMQQQLLKDIDERFWKRVEILINEVIEKVDSLTRNDFKLTTLYPEKCCDNIGKKRYDLVLKHFKENILSKSEVNELIPNIKSEKRVFGIKGIRECMVQLIMTSINNDNVSRHKKMKKGFLEEKEKSIRKFSIKVSSQRKEDEEEADDLLFGDDSEEEK